MGTAISMSERNGSAQPRLRSTAKRAAFKVIEGDWQGKETPVSRVIARYARSLPCSPDLAALLIEWSSASNLAFAANEELDRAEIERLRVRDLASNFSRLWRRAADAVARVDRIEHAITRFRASSISDVLMKLRFHAAVTDLETGAEAGHSDAVMLATIIRDVERLAGRLSAS